MMREEITPPRKKARVQLWGGHLDGLHATVDVGVFTGPPAAVGVPVSPGTMPLLLLSDEEARERYAETVCYRLDLDHAGEELLYRFERKVDA